MTDRIQIAAEAKILPDVEQLLRDGDAYFADLYPPESNHLLETSELEQPEVTFFVARLNGKAVGCGGYVIKEDYGEIKRLYVSPDGRGKRTGKTLMETIEAHARASGLSVLKLEMGIHQPEARQLYLAFGYREIPPFGDYQPDPLSIFMEKNL